MIHHFCAMGAAIPYSRMALKTVAGYIKTVLTPTNGLTAAKSALRLFFIV
jgi:hypothetical protein